jgi:hypothetical protein
MAFLHLRGRQSFAPLTATCLGQVLERARFRFEPMESLEESSSHRQRETSAHFGDVLERARPAQSPIRIASKFLPAGV